MKWTVYDECGTPWESALKKQLSKSNSSLNLLFWTPTMLHISLFFLTALNVNNWRFYPCKRALKFEILLESARIIFHCCSHFFFYCFFFIFEKFQEHSSGNRRQFWSKVSECDNLVNMHFKAQTKSQNQMEEPKKHTRNQWGSHLQNTRPILVPHTSYINYKENSNTYFIWIFLPLRLFQVR